MSAKEPHIRERCFGLNQAYM